MTNEKSISHLNDVLETLIDSSDGYAKATEVADREVFKNFFVRRSAARRAMATEIKAEIKQLGGEPENEGTILAKAHRVFLTISAALQDNDEAAIEAVDTGEEHLRDKIEQALQTDELSVSSKAILSNFQGELRADKRLIDYLEEAVD
ncbi:PA2169 family four-helix-bundle protein [Parasphingorhabdus cellanae]|uniref:PA2169 family four-helix-bundle protein n=1 Tax=Parasphingorhabdus cellanae TaxID=2806553 RepID=A0ABX7T6Z3_9SPHN|nr:PA2169 family four-helix-bundle protein [Parasphingorhabdus cellanae]QTD57379.1 PA2169 family four-helix-bundle protein [Parasphingorhabdus cellanae]